MKAGSNTHQLSIRGGVPLHGRVQVSGAKNAATKILLASLLTDEPSYFTNVPYLGDTLITAELMKHFGAQVDIQENDWSVNPEKIVSGEAPKDGRKNRISVLAIGPMLHRVSEVEVPLVGGDQIGPRPVDYHLAALRMMGANIEIKDDRIRASAKKLVGTSVTLPFPSVGATENIILAAVLAEGKTTIRNGAVEPEVLDLVKMLQTMGAIIELGTNRVFHIQGVKALRGTRYTIMPDRNEAVSFACAALATDGDVTVVGALQDHLLTWLNTVRRMGGKYEVLPDGIRFYRGRELHGIELETDTHPGFMTDWQQPTATVLTQAQGDSLIHETVYEDRLGYTKALKSMGAKIMVTDDCLGVLPCRWWSRGFQHSCRITGPTPLHGAMVDISDIRAGMAQVIAGLVAEGQTILRGVEHLDRGYQHLDRRLTQIGARLERLPTVY